MSLLTLALLFGMLSPSIEVAIAEGSQDDRPNQFTSIEAFERLSIRTSYWAEVKVDFRKPGNFVLAGGKPNLQRIFFYNEEGKLLKQGNHLLIAAAKKQEAKYFLFYEFVDDKDKNLLSIGLYPEIDFLTNRNQVRIKQMAFQAVLIFPCLVSFFFFFFTKKRVYIYYSLYILSLLFFFAYQYGLLSRLIPSINGIPPQWIWLLTFVITIWYLLFSTAFLDLQKTDPFAQKLIQFAYVFLTLFFLISATLYVLRIDVQHSIAFKAPFIAVEAVLLSWFAARIWNHPYKIKVYYLIGFLLLFLISISGQSLSTKQIASDQNDIYQALIVLEVFILALGLGVRMNEIQKKEVQTQERLIRQLKITERLQRDYAAKLEVTVTKRTQELTRQTDAYKLLLQELHHRVKNNLQMITSLLNMHQRRSSGSEEITSVFTTTRNKIKSLAMLHEFLYKSEDLSTLCLKGYVQDLAHMIMKSLQTTPFIRLSVDIERVATNIDTALSVGIILNELVTNSLKYSIGDQQDPEISIRLHQVNQELHLSVSDKGPGIQENDWQIGMGYTLIRSIVDNHKGQLIIDQKTGLFTVTTVFKDY